MELSELTELLKGPADELVNQIKSLAPEIDEAAFDIDPENHKVTKTEFRPQRRVEIPTGVLGPDGQMTSRTEYRDVHRIPSATEKIIIDWCVNMSLGAGVQIDCKPKSSTDETMLAMVERTLEDNKMDFIRMEIERLRLTYLQVLVVWYFAEADGDFWSEVAPEAPNIRMRCRYFSPEDGSIIVPLRDQFGDMVGVARLYQVKLKGKDVNKMDVIIDEGTITYIEANGEWAKEKPYENKLGKNKVEKALFILHEGKRRLTKDVEPKLERREEIDSDTADENKQSAFPILVAKGEIIDTKGGENANTRKTFQVENGGGLEYVETKGGQEAAKMERENMIRDIYMETNTPYISPESISGNSNISGVAIELMYLPTTNQAKSLQQGSIGMAEQRQLNLLKYGMAAIFPAVRSSRGLAMKPKYSVNLPKNVSEIYDNVTKLFSAGLISRETAVRQLAIVDNPEEEISKIEQDIKRQNALSPSPLNVGEE